MPVLSSKKDNVDFVHTLAVSYAIMFQVNTKIANGTFESLEKINPIEVSETVEKTSNTNNFKYWASDLIYLINLDNSRSLYSLDIIEKYEGSAAVGLYKGRPVNEINLYNSSILTPLDNSSDDFLEINLSTYPLPHKGNRIKLNRNSILLYVDNIESENPQWRLVGVLDSKTRQVTLGLIFSEYSTDTGELVLPAEESKPTFKAMS